MEKWVSDFIERIDQLSPDSTPTFGKMNVSQMLCHCADQLRLINHELKIGFDDRIAPNELVALSRAGKSVPTPKGLDQVNGEGTQPTSFDADKETLKQLLISYAELPTDFNCGLHPYFGNIDKEAWHRLVLYHLNHHLTQFSV
ncbi:MAG: DUF1569 domain-containing protein [Cytophagales bacterium]|nr:MAG: DUF1569 domain-containing protein [Cytophagales bacterium]